MLGDMKNVPLETEVTTSLTVDPTVKFGPPEQVPIGRYIS